MSTAEPDRGRPQAPVLHEPGAARHEEEPERGSAYGAPEAGGVLAGADDPADEGPSLGGDDPDAIPANKDVLGTATSDVP